MRHLRVSTAWVVRTFMAFVAVLLSASNVLSAQSTTERAEKERIERTHEMLMGIIRNSSDTPTAKLVGGTTEGAQRADTATPKPDTPKAKATSDSSSIVGSWRTQGEILIFHSNGKFEKVSHSAPGDFVSSGLNDSGSYMVSGDKLSLRGSLYLKRTCEFSVNGNRLKFCNESYTRETSTGGSQGQTTTKTCPSCQGTGKAHPATNVKCSSCNGTGRVTVGR